MIVAARVGIDLVALGEVEDSLARHAERWVTRVFTPAEVEDCRVGEGFDPGRLGARLAAKEAVLKILAPTRADAIAWHAIEVRGGRVRLSGAAAARAADAQIGELALSTSRCADHAMAIVIESSGIQREVPACR